MSSRNARRRSQGFSLVEMLVVVTITGVLALVGVMLFRKYIASSKGAEAASVIQAIRAAEESYLAENHLYLNVSTATNWYPVVTPGTSLHSWKVGPGGHPDVNNWNALAPAITRSVQFGYLANAGIAGTARTTPQTAQNPNWPAPTDAWYLIQARGDVNGDGVFSEYVASEADSELYVENEGQ
jgi:prepilin-type N-terminal cleavage/methylation domain-containing protein